MSLLRRRNPGSVARAGGAVALMLLLAACATGPKYGPDSPVTTLVVPVERLAYPPLLPKLPVTAGIHYPESFRNAVAMAGGGDTPRYRYELGAAAVALFDQHAAAMFARTVALPDPPAPTGKPGGVDLVLVPRFQSAPTYFILGMDVLTPEGSTIAKLATFGIETPAPDERSTLPRVQLPIPAKQFFTDRLGDLATAMVLSPEVARWAEARGFTWQWADAVQPALTVTPDDGVTIVVCDGLNCDANVHTLAVGDALRKLDPTIRIIPSDEIRRVLHPWLGYANLSDAQVTEFLRRPAVANRAGAAGVRYVVIARSLHQWTEEHGSIGGFGGYGGGGLIGLLWWTSHESARVHVFDFATAAEAGDVNHQREDVTFALPAFIIPVPIPIPKSGEPMAEVVARQLLPLVRPKR